MFSIIRKKPTPTNANGSLLRVGDGETNDSIDGLDFENHYEDPERYEASVADLVEKARTDRSIDDLLFAARMHPDRAEVFRRFYEQGTHRELIALMAQFGINETARICDVGCGPGYTAWSLWKDGFRNVAAMDPNGTRLTGTGYLAEITDGSIETINDLTAWGKGGRNYDAIFTKATVHHWQHIPQVAIQLRRNLKPGGYWFCVNEFIANSATQVVAHLNGHLLWNKLKTYEWPYPASAYADLILSAGFDLDAVIPQFYHGNSVAGHFPPLPQGLNIAALESFVDRSLVAGTKDTVDAFWAEVDHFRRSQSGINLYVRPQAFVFRRCAV